MVVRTLIPGVLVAVAWLGVSLPGCKDQSGPRLDAGEGVLAEGNSGLKRVGVLAEFALPDPGELILVSVALKTKHLLFAIDTGSSCWVFDKDLTAELGPPIDTTEVDTPFGTTVRNVYRAPNVALERATLGEGQRALVADLSALRKESRKDIRGIIGMSALSKYCLYLDWNHGKGRILASGQAEREAWWAAIPLHYGNANTPYVSVDVEGVSAYNFLLDTGDVSEGSLANPFFERFVRDGNKTVRHSSTANGDAVDKLSRFSLAIGGHTYNDMLLSASSRSTLGLAFLARHVVWIDFARGTLYLARRGDHDTLTPDGRSGLQCAVQEGRLVVAVVEPNSPASYSGLLVGDEIVRLVGYDSGSLGLGRVKRILAETGKEIILDIVRDGRRRTVRFTVVKWV